MTFRSGGPPPGQRTVHVNTRSPHTIGLACPSPGRSALHRTFSRPGPPHFSGNPFSAVYPRPVGPRNWGQFSARAGAVRNAKTKATRTVHFFIVVPLAAFELVPGGARPRA